MASFRHLVLFSLLLTGWSTTSDAIWFEASGQAVIERGDKKLARQRATQEAIKQALLFAGASVKSVQQMANGLLQDEKFIVRASGEVNNIELISEVYHDDYVTVSIRADIFPQTTDCDASDYSKTLVTTWFGIENRQQAATGAIHRIGQQIPLRLQQHLDQLGNHAVIRNIAPHTLSPRQMRQTSSAMVLAQKNDSQFVLTGSISDLSMELSEATSLAFWQDHTPKRNFALQVNLVDGTTGAKLFQRRFATHASWSCDLHEQVDVQSERFWQSDFGQQVGQIIQQVADDIDEAVSCHAAYGKILRVANNKVQVDIGSNQGVKAGDELTLFQMNQFYDPSGQQHQQYQLHPATLVVTQVYPDSAVMEPSDGSLLANVQPNDFVARR